jgi:predicted RNA-binding Zn-ribbon protein involved in translation (DUF1610 family)
MDERTCLNCGISIAERHHSAKWCKSCGDKHEIERRRQWLRDHQQEIYARRSERIGRKKRSSSIKIVGPYRVKHIEKDAWEVVELEDIKNDVFHSLRPRKAYDYPQPAYGLCKRLNLKWQNDHRLDENYHQMFEYFSGISNV